jgi:hypothetical protein
VKTKIFLATTSFMTQKLKKNFYFIGHCGNSAQLQKNKLGNACYTNFLKNLIELVLLAQKDFKKHTQKGSDNARHSCEP